jgi:hypothetical protein
VSLAALGEVSEGRSDQRSVLSEKKKRSAKGTERLTGLDLLLGGKLGVSVNDLAFGVERRAHEKELKTRTEKKEGEREPIDDENHDDA